MTAKLEMSTVVHWDRWIVETEGIIYIMIKLFPPLIVPRRTIPFERKGTMILSTQNCSSILMKQFVFHIY